jgi:hypothetical protein
MIITSAYIGRGVIITSAYIGNFFFCKNDVEISQISTGRNFVAVVGVFISARWNYIGKTF